jgi:hypothetical protein
MIATLGSFAIWIGFAILAGIVEEKFDLGKPAVFGLFLGWCAFSLAHYFFGYGNTCMPNTASIRTFL